MSLPNKRQAMRVQHGPAVAMGVVVALAAGCGSSSSSDTGDGVEQPAATTWHGSVAPVVAERCAGCHTAGGIAPFSMDSFEEAAPYAALMAEQVLAGTMPPFLAAETDTCVPRHGWRNDIRLTDAEKALIADWAEAQAPEGDAARAAELPEPVAFALPDADLNVRIPVSTQVDGTTDQFWCYVLETGLAEDAWVDAIQVNAGNARIVHHVLLYNDANFSLDQEKVDAGKYECFGGTGVSNLMTAWAPGSIPNEAPQGAAWEVKQGARLVAQVHYHPTGEPEVDDSTSFDLRFAASAPQYSARTVFIGNFVNPNIQGGLLPGPNDPPNTIEFKIPAGVKDHTESSFNRVSSEMIIYGASTHMHWVGTRMQIHLQHGSPDPGVPGRECLVDVPQWDFNWQRGYQFDAPLSEVPVAKPGDVIELQCTYDNTLDNPLVREALAEQGLDAPRDVFMGEATLDEMCLGVFGVATPVEAEM